MSEGIHGFEGEFRWLSNFAKSPILYDDEIYPTVEHAYQAAKAREKVDRDMIRFAPTPAVAKQLGRKIELRNDWEDVKLEIMLNLTRKKYMTHQYLREKLLATGDAYIEETNWWGDTFWGVCRGEGKNHLGLIIMQVRDEVRGFVSRGIRFPGSGDN